jgi:hypothetical protein
MNLLLTWATGGTPMGDPAKAPAPVALDTEWPLGPPDLELPFPEEITIAEDVQRRTVDVLIPTGSSSPSWVSAVDLRPGTPALVRSASIELVPASAPATLLALWLPGDQPVKTAAGTAFELPVGATLHVRVHYRKTWQYERQAMKDRSTIGLYFGDGRSPVRPLVISPGAGASPQGRRLSFTHIVESDVRALAVHPGEGLANTNVAVTAIAPDGTRQMLIDFTPRADWLRRFWFREPVALARGTRLEISVSIDDEPMGLPSGTPAAPPGLDPGRMTLTLDVVAGSQ